MNIFRLFFVSTVLIPVLVVAATTDEDGLRIRRSRSIVIAEDGTRTGRRHRPVNISDSDCPSLGCTGNLTTHLYNGKGSVTTTVTTSQENGASVPSSKERRSDSSSASTTSFHHDRPLKLEIKSIKNSTRSDPFDNNSYVVSQDSFGQVGTGRVIFSSAVLLSWAVYWIGRAVVSFIGLSIAKYVWNRFRKAYGIGDDYIEYYVKLGQDDKHPFHKYGGGWNPTFGVSLKSKVEKLPEHGWKGPPVGWHEHEHEHASSYHKFHPHGAWPEHHGWGWPPHEEKKGWKSKEKEEEMNLRHKFDKEKGWKIAQKQTKKYGKKASKYGLRPSKFSYMYDENGNIVLGNEGYAWGWARR